jgi:hypothetical protein
MDEGGQLSAGKGATRGETIGIETYFQSRAFRRIKKIKHNLAETPEINHNLAKNRGRRFDTLLNRRKIICPTCRLFGNLVFLNS